MTKWIAHAFVIVGKFLIWMKEMPVEVVAQFIANDALENILEHAKSAK